MKKNYEENKFLHYGAKVAEFVWRTNNLLNLCSGNYLLIQPEGSKRAVPFQISRCTSVVPSSLLV